MLLHSQNAQKYEDVTDIPEYVIGGKVARIFNNEKSVVLIKNVAIEDLLITPHFHDWLEFSYMLEGEQEVTIGNRTYIMSAGDFLMVDSNVLHCNYSRKTSKKITFQIKKDYIQHITPAFHSSQVYCNSTTITDLDSYYRYKHLITLYLDMVECFEKHKEDPREEMGFVGYLLLFLRDLMMNFPKPEAEEDLESVSGSSDYLQQILSYLHKHYEEEISLKSLSEIFHMTPDAISRLIKDALGIGYKEYLSQIQLNHACFEVANSDKSLTDIAMECGFPSSKAFIQAFKDHYDMTPLKYRKQARLERQKNNISPESQKQLVRTDSDSGFDPD